MNRFVDAWPASDFMLTHLKNVRQKLVGRKGRKDKSKGKDKEKDGGDEDEDEDDSEEE